MRRPAASPAALARPAALLPVAVSPSALQAAASSPAATAVSERSAAASAASNPPPCLAQLRPAQRVGLGSQPPSRGLQPAGRGGELRTALPLEGGQGQAGPQQDQEDHQSADNNRQPILVHSRGRLACGPLSGYLLHGSCLHGIGFHRGTSRRAGFVEAPIFVPRHGPGCQGKCRGIGKSCGYINRINEDNIRFVQTLEYLTSRTAAGTLGS